MATATGSVRRRSKDSFTIIAPAGRDPETGRYRQRWQTVKRNPGESDAALKARAEKELRKLLIRIDEGQEIAAGKLTLSDYIIGEWLPSIHLRVSARTAYGYEQILRRHVLPVIGNRQLDKLRGSDVERVYRRMADKGLSGTTQLHCHRVLFMALKAAKRQRKIYYNPCEEIDAPRKEAFVLEPLSPEEVGRLVAAASVTDIGVLVRLLAYTGLRLGEALGLRWKDVDLDAGVLHVRQTRKQHEAAEYGQPKTDRSRRSVDLVPELVATLRDYRSGQLSFYRENGFVDPNDLVFTLVTKAGIRGMGHDHVSNIWKKVRARAGVPRARLHDLRHAAATFMVSAGVPIVDVSAVLGHGRTSTTVDVYSHFIPGRGKAAVREIQRVLAGK